MSQLAARLRLVSLSIRGRRPLSSYPPPSPNYSPSTSPKLPLGNSQELGFYYRHPGAVSRNQRLIMEGFGALTWFYVLYHVYHYPAMVFGHPSYPNPRKWTDAELGIPPE